LQPMGRVCTVDGAKERNVSERTTRIHPSRPPKKYPRKSLHGRVRGCFIPYEDPVRVRKFYLAAFGWDIFKLPPGVLGNNADDVNPNYWCATGPNTVVWEGIVPGFCNAGLFHRASAKDKPHVLMECDSIEKYTRKIEEKGGKVLSGRDDTGDWANVALCEDPAGNRILLWQVPDSRTWEEPETGYDQE